MFYVGIPPREVTDKEIIPMPQEIPIHKWCGGSSNGKRVRMVVPTHSCEGYPELVNYWLTINLGSGIDYGPSESSPCLCGRDVFLE